MILVLSELLSQEQDFRRYCCPGTGDDVHELQSVPQQFPDDKDEADVASPGDLQSKHGSSASHRTEQAFATNARKFLEFEPALMHFTNRRGFCGAQASSKWSTPPGAFHDKAERF